MIFLPAKHRNVSANGILKAIEKYEEEVMDAGQVKCRLKYGSELSRNSLARNVEQWAVHLPPLPQPTR